jgi:hypothetical protein
LLQIWVAAGGEASALDKKMQRQDLELYKDDETGRQSNRKTGGWKESRQSDAGRDAICADERHGSGRDGMSRGCKTNEKPTMLSMQRVKEKVGPRGTTHHEHPREAGQVERRGSVRRW